MDWYWRSRERGLQTNIGIEHGRTHTHGHAGLHEDSIPFHHLCRAVEWKAVESVDEIFIKHVQVLHLLH